MTEPQEPWFAVSRWHGRISGKPIHWRGWLATLAAIAAPHSAWLAVLVPGVPGWSVGLLSLSLLLGSLYWLFRLMLRRGRITDYRN